MKLTTGILAMAMMAGGSAAVQAQNTDAIDNARSIAKSLQQKQANDTNAALDAAGVSQTAKPAPGAPAPAVKPATIPASKPVSAAASAPVKISAKPAPASSQHNQLKNVSVVKGADKIQIELSSSQAVTPRLSKLDSPARVVVELPETVSATSENKIPVGSAGVKGVRIGTDGKNPPTTSVVVDLDKSIAYELTPGPGDKLILTLHTQGGSVPTVAKSAPSPAASKPALVTASSPVKTAEVLKTSAAVKSSAPAVQPASSPKTVAVKAAEVPKITVVKTPATKSEPAPKTTVAKAEAAPTPTLVAANAPAADPFKPADSAKPKQEDKKWAMNGKRDPFFSPVVQQNGSGCSTGKKCLEIGNINVRGVVKSDNGFIAVVTNNLNKAYFLRENDPVFNGYVVKITGDSVVFQETVQDKLGKPMTREVVKRILTPAV
jgi:Tfp pilus assembly protein PilP